MRKFLSSAKYLIGHNIIRWDIPTLERLLDIKIEAKLIDTLAISFYLEPHRQKHGLESYGEDFGVKKPVIDDWENQTQEEYEHRCEEDVEINSRLWTYQLRRLRAIYKDDKLLEDFLDYLSFKMDCAREQERSQWKLDKELCETTLNQITTMIEEKTTELAAAMPKVPIKTKRKKPKILFRKDGSLSVHGQSWAKLMESKGLPLEYDEEVEVITGWNDPNPGSHIQIKSWLDSLGWVPRTFKYDRDKETGGVREIPQVRDDKTGELCESVKELIEKEPSIEVLEGLSILRHRKTVFEGFLKAVNDEGYVYAGIQGLTNTLRFKHSVCVNLPKVNRPWGSEIRGSLMAREGNTLCGSDMSSLEDRIKQHFLFDYDPEYVESLNQKGYDPHLSIALIAGMVTEEEVSFYKYYKDLDEEAKNKLNNPQESLEDFVAINKIRDKAKNANYACQYGAGAPRIALTAGIDIEEAENLHKAYWNMNWAIKAVAGAQRTQTVDGQMWLQNPINKFWYSLRFEKDIFSTLVQGTAAYVFDLWVKEFRGVRPQLTAQFHDEVVLELLQGREEHIERLLIEAISRVNNRLKLNRELGVDVAFGVRYSEIH